MNDICSGSTYIELACIVDDMTAYKAARPSMFCPVCGRLTRVGMTRRVFGSGTDVWLLKLRDHQHAKSDE